MKTFISIVALMAALVLVGWLGRRSIAQVQTQSQESIARKVQNLFTDPDAFKASLIQAIREAGNHDEEHDKLHKKLFETDGPWGKILAEKEAVLQEALGPAYKSHRNLTAFEVEVLYNLGKLDVIRNYEAFQQLRAGNPYHRSNR